MINYYHILEYTTSELQSDGKPFAIVLYQDEERPSTLGGFILRNWEEVLCHRAPSEISVIRDFLSDVAHYSQAEEILSKGFFQHLGALSTGPIRTFVSGNCSLEDLDSLSNTFFGLATCGNPWQAFFDSVREDSWEISDTSGIPS
ncbi:hypothetical protein GCM10011507_34190 [Edaphobacter acidisoli]|uniref:Uncharacterized protein n=1 Tax=Edaphobacter acidisoli TaxID=2040573 RepID=A0A916WA89_9BACT|nr:hypothetical protein [Edaphobacter acidisoli]GGA80089.1 hypothetical protein GCM10011507_34190 [Edaphobacter acidisoli]